MKQSIKFIYTYGNEKIEITTEAVFIDDQVQAFRSFLLAIGHAPENVKLITYNQEEEV